MAGQRKERPSSWAEAKEKHLLPALQFYIFFFFLFFFCFGSAISLDAAKCRNATFLSPGCKLNIRERLKSKPLNTVYGHGSGQVRPRALCPGSAPSIVPPLSFRLPPWDSVLFFLHACPCKVFSLAGWTSREESGKMPCPSPFPCRFAGRSC